MGGGAMGLCPLDSHDKMKISLFQPLKISGVNLLLVLKEV